MTSFHHLEVFVEYIRNM